MMSIIAALGGRVTCKEVSGSSWCRSQCLADWTGLDWMQRCARRHAVDPEMGQQDPGPSTETHNVVVVVAPDLIELQQYTTAHATTLDHAAQHTVLD